MGEDGTIVVVDLVAVTMALVDCFCSIQRVCLGALIQLTGIGAKAECAADIAIGVLIGHERDDRMRGLRVELNTVRVMQLADIAGEFND